MKAFLFWFATCYQGLSKSPIKKVTSIPTDMSSTTRQFIGPIHWSQGLLASMNDPKEKIEEDQDIVVIKDKYPKARFHYLILPKKDIPSINKITRDDLGLLSHMESVANKYAAKHKEYEFQIGYHAVPSMQRLHLHVISTDFDSRCMKTKLHWNIFTTPYFISSEDVRKLVEENGHIKIDSKVKEKYINQDLKCHKCSYSPKTMPDLKKHILKHIPRQ